MKRNFLNIRKKIKSSNKNNQLVILNDIYLFLERGLSLPETLVILEEKMKATPFIPFFEQGWSFYETIRHYEFDEDILLVIKVAEESGRLKKGISDAITLLEEKVKYKKEFGELLKYPLLLLLLAIGGIGFISLFLIPQFESIYASLGVEINGVINLIFTSIRMVPLVAFSILVLVIFLVVLFWRQERPRRLQIISRLPVIGAKYKKMYNYIFSLNVLSLMSLDIKQNQIFTILANQNHNILLKSQSAIIFNKLQTGMSLAEVLDPGLYDKELRKIIAAGERQNCLISYLSNYTHYLKETQTNSQRRLLFLVQPIFYLVFGGIIVLLYASIFIPMFKMLQSF